MGVAGSPDALRTLLRLNAAQPLLYAISTFQPSDPDALKAALARALRALSAAVAETVGPSQWGLASHSSDLRREAKAALDYAFQVSVSARAPLYLLSDRTPARSLGRIHPPPPRPRTASQHRGRAAPCVRRSRQRPPSCCV